MRVSFPEKLEPLFLNSRYKVVVGGRGKGASWGIARALLILGANKKLRILCAREIQKSLKESSKQLLEEQIELMGLSSQYESLETEIRNNLTGTVFAFTGLKEHTIMSIKSYEGFDICWVAEGQSVKKGSWKILTPTIRKEGSEIWIDINPELDDDYTYLHFVVNPPPNTMVIEMSYLDNPFFTSTLEAERAHSERTDTLEDYENIWLGKPRSTVPGAIYGKEVLQMIKDNRYTFVPYDPRLKVHTFWDMGWNDRMAIILAQQQFKEARIIAYYEGSFKRTDEWGADLNALKLNWGWDYLPPDGYSEERKTGTTDYAILRKMGRRVKPKHLSFPEHDPELGIRSVRNLFPKLLINKNGPGIDRLWECIKRYRRNIPKTTNEPAQPVHDEYSHANSALKGLALMIDKLSNDDEPLNAPLVAPFKVHDRATGVLG
jgi:phage terminase large subunit